MSAIITDIDAAVRERFDREVDERMPLVRERVGPRPSDLELLMGVRPQIFREMLDIVSIESGEYRALHRLGVYYGILAPR